MQLLTSLVHLNNVCLLHCDVKPHNIVARPSFNTQSTFFDVTLADLGCAAPKTLLRAVGVGAVYYMCPVQYLAQFQSGSEPGRPACIDVWALGAVTAELFCNKRLSSVLFSCQHGLHCEHNLKALHQTQGFTPLVEELLLDPAGGQLPEKWRFFIRRCLEYNPAHRPGP